MMTPTSQPFHQQQKMGQQNSHIQQMQAQIQNFNNYLSGDLRQASVRDPSIQPETRTNKNVSD